MAKAWDNYLGGKGLGRFQREDFMQKLRQLVDIDVPYSPSDIGIPAKNAEYIHDFSIPDVDIGDADDTEIVHGVSEIIIESHTEATLAEETSTEADIEIGVHQGIQENHVDTIHETHNIVQNVFDELFMSDEGIEIAHWTCANHHNLERDVAIYPSDTAVLLKMPDDSMMLAYNIGGEGRSHCGVDSLEQAEEMIFEDNESTQELYPDMPEALWCRV